MKGQRYVLSELEGCLGALSLSHSAYPQTGHLFLHRVTRQALIDLDGFTRAGFQLGRRHRGRSKVHAGKGCNQKNHNVR